MSYEFIDTTEQAKTYLPKEAMSYNGIFLENEIKGYRTLNVSGRELYGNTIESASIDGIDGSQYRYKTLPSRTITVKYQLIAESDREFRNAFNKMNLLLDEEQVQVIFNDELDKYFIGTKASNTVVSAGSNSVTGEIEIYCTDPLKYSTVLKEFKGEVVDNELVINITNEGTMPCTVDYEVVNNTENGYLGITSEHGVMEFGKINEVDGATYEENETLVTLKDFYNASDDVGGYDCMHPLYGTKGSLEKKYISSIGSTKVNENFLMLKSAGTTVGDANGGLRTITIPNDSSGSKGATNWYSYFHLLQYANEWGQTGEMSISFITDDNKLIAGCNFVKTTSNSNVGEYQVVVYNPNKKDTDKMAGKVLKTFSYTTSHIQSQNPWYWNWGHCDVRKIDDKITFFYNSKYYTFTVPEIKNLVCTKIQIAIKEYKGRTGNKYTKYLGFNNLRFEKMNVEKWVNVPNRYASGSVLTIDGNTGCFYVDDMLKQNDEVLGTKYFKVPNGDTQVKIHVSDFVTENPTVTARIREVWL